MADDDEIILSELSDDELVLQMHDDLYDGLKEEIEEGVNILIERGWAPYDVLTKALVAGMPRTSSKCAVKQMSSQLRDKSDASVHSEYDR